MSAPPWHIQGLSILMLWQPKGWALYLGFLLVTVTRGLWQVWASLWKRRRHLYPVLFLVLRKLFPHLSLFIMVEYIQHNIYNFNHSQIHKSVALSTFTVFYNHHHSIPKTLSSFPAKPLYPLNNNFPFPLAPNNLYSIFCLYELAYYRYLM